MEECLICAFSFNDTNVSNDSKSNTQLSKTSHIKNNSFSRLRCYSNCAHCPDLCSICLIRIRSLQKKFTCPVCKISLPYIICSNEKNISFNNFDIYGESCGPDHVFDPRSQMFFPKEYYKSQVEPLFNWKCQVCNTKRGDIHNMRKHLQIEHNLQVCMLCIDNKQVFPSEQKVYIQSYYENHLKKGDNDGSEGHPNCEFCRKRFYDKISLFTHLSKDHYTCHLCEKNGIQFKYFDKYQNLEHHFRNSHYICEEVSCLQKQFVAFNNSIELANHNINWHPFINQSRSIPMQFSYKKSSSLQSSSNMYIRPNSEFDDEPDLSKSRIDAGLAGRVDSNGEWQIEIQGSIDERERSRQLNREALQRIDNEFVELDNKEEYPSLLRDSITCYNGPPLGWVNSSKIGKGKQKNDFPELFLSAEQRSSADSRRSQLTSNNRVTHIQKSIVGNNSKKSLLSNISSASINVPNSASESWNGLEVKIKTNKKNSSKNNSNTPNIEVQANTNNIMNSNNDQFIEDDISLAIALSESSKQSNLETCISQSSSPQLNKSLSNSVKGLTIPTTQTLTINDNEEFLQPNINEFPPPPPPPPPFKENKTNSIEIIKKKNIAAKKSSISGWGNALKEFGSSSNNNKNSQQTKQGLTVFKTINKSIDGIIKNNKEDHIIKVNMNDKFQPVLNDCLSINSSASSDFSSINNEFVSSNNKYVSLITRQSELEEYPILGINNKNSKTNNNNYVNIKNISTWGSKSIGGSNEIKKNISDNKQSKKSLQNMDLKNLAFGNYTK